MSLERAVHQRWVAYRPLERRVPASRVFTGIAAGDVALPYATVNRISTSISERTTDNEIEEVVLRFEVWTSTLDEAQDIGATIHERFDGAQFEFDGGRCLAMTHIRSDQELRQRGDWRLSSDYQVITLSERGD